MKIIKPQARRCMQFYPYLCRRIIIIITIALMKPDALAVANYLLELEKRKV